MTGLREMADSPSSHVSIYLVAASIISFSLSAWIISFFGVQLITVTFMEIIIINTAVLFTLQKKKVHYLLIGALLGCLLATMLSALIFPYSVSLIYISPLWIISALCLVKVLRQNHFGLRKNPIFIVMLLAFFIFNILPFTFLVAPF